MIYYFIDDEVRREVINSLSSPIKKKGTAESCLVKPMEKLVTNVKGCNITHYFTTNGMHEYTSCKETISEAWKLFNKIHAMFEGDAVIMHKIADGSILGQAYAKAVLKWNGNDSLELIPSSEVCWQSLKELVKLYIQNGYIMTQEWSDAIFK